MLKKRTTLILSLLIVPFLALSAGCSDDDDNGLNPATIVDTAIANGNFTTLVAALQAGDLVNTLSGAGPFTVFAPTDAAFAALPAGVVDDLLLPQNQAALQDILLYHVAAGEKLAAEVVAGPTVTTLQGSDVTVTVNGQMVMLDQANIIQTDIQTSNGVIHVIDAVLIP